MSINQFLVTLKTTKLLKVGRRGLLSQLRVGGIGSRYLSFSSGMFIFYIEFLSFLCAINVFTFLRDLSLCLSKHQIKIC